MIYAKGICLFVKAGMSVVVLFGRVMKVIRFRTLFIGFACLR